MKYHKIQSLYKRDEQGRFLLGKYTRPVFSMLSQMEWQLSEKLDGMNIRVYYNHRFEPVFHGRTDNAHLPAKLVTWLREKFQKDALESYFRRHGVEEAVLYGEGVGAGIQKGGGNYGEQQHFKLFDVQVVYPEGSRVWLTQDAVSECAKGLYLERASILGYMNLPDTVQLVSRGFTSAHGHFLAEGVVLRPQQELYDRFGNRVITKLKYKDFQ